MIKRVIFLTLACCGLTGHAAEMEAKKPAGKPAVAKPTPAKSTAAKPAAPKPALPDSKIMEQDMQNLPWLQFRSVVEAVPKLRAEVEAYGALGWTYVQSKYKTHRWKKNIERMDVEEQRQLAALIAKAKRAR